MIGFAVFWLVSCFFLVIPVPKMRKLVYVKLVVFIISALAMLGWTVGKAGGLGPVARQGSTVHGSEKSWLVRSVSTDTSSPVDDPPQTCSLIQAEQSLANVTL